MSDPIVIVGAGQAGLQIAEGLRSGGWQGGVLLLGEEPHAPYHRPPLSKAWLAGQAGAAQLQMRAPEALAKKGIELRTELRVDRIDRQARRLELADGSRVAYAGLALATGAHARMPDFPGARAAGVVALRTRDDADGVAGLLGDCVERKRPLVVIGGGFIGLEVAATARQRGIEVTVLEAAPRLMGRAVAPVISEWYAKLHASHGVAVLLGQQVDGIVDEGDGWHSVHVRGGIVHRAGSVLIAVGAVPNDGLARDAGLECDRGVIVDECSRTSDPAIVAAGDCTARRMSDGTLRRLESVQNAVEQGRAAAATLLGQPKPFSAAPWFWSDQYDRKLQMVGAWFGADRHVVRGDLSGNAFSIFHYVGDRLVAVDSINAPREHLACRKLLDAGASPTPAEVADPAYDLAKASLPAAPAAS